MTTILAELARMKALADAATPGPWEYTETGYGSFVSLPKDVLGQYCNIAEMLPACGGIMEDDAAFIASARTDMTKLIEALTLIVERLERDHRNAVVCNHVENFPCTACITLQDIQTILSK